MTKTTQKSKIRIWFGRILGVLLGLVLVATVALLVMVFVNIFSGKDNQVFGYRLVYVLTDSMSPELEPHETILAKSCTAYDVEVGDYVIFVSPSGPLKGYKITHAVVAKPYINPEDGEWYILTRGIKQGAPIDDPVPVGNVLAKYVRKLPVITFVVGLLKNPWGYALLIAAPLIAMLIFQFVRMAKVSAESESEAPKEEQAPPVEDTEAIKAEIARRAVEEYIAAQKAAKPDGNDGKKDSDDA